MSRPRPLGRKRRCPFAGGPALGFPLFDFFRVPAREDIDMSLFEQIDKDYVQAYKAKDAVRLSVLRLLKTAVKKVRLAVEAKDVDAAQDAANKASRLLDKAASKGIIHKNQAAQRKSGVQKLVNTIK